MLILMGVRKTRTPSLERFEGVAKTDTHCLGWYDYTLRLYGVAVLNQSHLNLLIPNGGGIKTMTPSMKLEGVKESLTPCHSEIRLLIFYV